MGRSGISKVWRKTDGIRPMNDEPLGDRFSARNFTRLGLNSEGAAILALELEQAVGAQVFIKLKEAAEGIVRQLNELGHALSLDEEQAGDPLLPVGISFRDEAGDVSGRARCKLRVAFDLTVSAGYAHLSDDLEDTRERMTMSRGVVVGIRRGAGGMKYQKKS
jgi:hypothetical protein